MFCKRLILVLIICLLLGCSKPIKREPTDYRLQWMALASIIKSRIETKMTVEEIAAELSYQKYMEKNK